MPRKIDIAVVGSGLFGAATCYWLAQEGLSVALLERTALTAGATGRNGGFVVVGPAEPYSDASAHLGYEAAHSCERDMSEPNVVVSDLAGRRDCV
ncbi:MAG: FAD-dependent oxidoreductase [Ktedonobacteraceae bacterium]